MTDLDTSRLRGRPAGRARSQTSEQARARRAAARERRAAEALVAAERAAPVALSEVTTELEPFVEPARTEEVELTRPARVRTSLARLDAATAARPFPDTSIGLDFFEPVTITFKQPLLVRLLRLQHVRPTGWQRAAVGDLPILLAVLLVLGDLATAWTLLVLPVVVLGLVKFHDIIESRLAPAPNVSPVTRPFGEAGV